jgi:hypothetical protein
MSTKGIVNELDSAVRSEPLKGTSDYVDALKGAASASPQIPQDRRAV